MNLVGHFYFKQTVNGNLYGEYSHNKMKDICTESSTLIKSGRVPFEGKYQSSWLDDANARTAELDIDVSTCNNQHHFTLVWKLGDKEIYRGEGSLCGAILIGHYWEL